ncbi:hypothetical protein N0B40_16035 [Chryseobacterium oranimense]|uniref:hypothetical protein n=1 Tax=Chryseobacterium oranimense TaxID=421058 RepID=UPI0021AFBBCA|nr:hypothetical protein [Chryseobacterium oranimense]UWX59916.1 hypothetical protein N0B40_16035 [Chryseobacterium oranimense]
MRKLMQLLFTFAAIISFSQSKEAIKFKGNILNYTENTYKSFKVIDQREDKQIGTLPFGEQKEMKEVVFPTTPDNDFSTWYLKSNQTGASTEFVMVLKRLKLSTGDSDGKKTEGKIDFSAQTFAKNGDKYRFLYKKDTVFTFYDKEISELMVKNIPTIFSVFIKKSYSLNPVGNSVSFSELGDYGNYVNNNYAALKEGELKDGIYLDYISFFNQTPEPGSYTFELNNKGDITRAVKEENGKKTKIPAYKMFAYVEKGKARKMTFSGFLDLDKDEHGFYITANRGHLFPVQSNSTYGMFGLIGGIAGAIEQGARQKKMKNGDVGKVYIDSLTGEYDFPDE